MCQKYSILFLIFFCHGLHAQKFELGAVSLKELQQASHPLDSSASAAVLFHKANTTFKYTYGKGFWLVHEFQIRIKIYKKEGLSYADWEIPYFVGYERLNPDMLKVSDGVTYNLEGGKIKKTKLTNEGTFKEKVNENWKTITVTFPEAKVGSIVEFKYVIRSENLLKFPTFKFQNNIPVDFAQYKTDIPLFYRYKKVVKGLADVQTEQEITTGHQNYDDQYGHSESMSYKQLSTVHTLKDVPALKNESFVDNIENYRSVIDYELESIQYPDEPEKNYSKTWEGVAKSIFDEDDFGKQLKMRDFFENDLRSLIADLKTPEEKMHAIFNYVRVKMAWNGEYGYYVDKGVKKAYLESTGNVAEINFILISMLNSAGIITKPVILSTINNGIAALPNQTGFNYVIAASEINGKRTLLDATSKFAVPDILPLRTLNWTGRLIGNSGQAEEIVMAPTFTSKRFTNTAIKIQPDHSIEGKVRIHSSEYDAFVFREQNANLNRESYLENLENEYGGIEIDNYTIENQTNLQQPILEQFEFKADGKIDVIGNRIYLKPLLLFSISKNPFTQQARKLPVYFGYPLAKRFMINIDIPEGYKIETLPAALSLTTGENVGNFKYMINATAQQIQLSIISEINFMMISETFYPILQDYFQKMTDKLNEQIILIKI